MNFPDIDANQRFARNLSPAFGVHKSILLTSSELTYQVLEDVVLSAPSNRKSATGAGG